MATDASPEKAPAGPSGLSARVEQMAADLAKPAEDAEVKTAPPVEAGKETKPEEKPAGKPAGKGFRFVGEDGKDIPFVMTVEGQEISEVDPEKVRTWAQLGYHANDRLKDLNDRQAALEAAEPLLANIMKAIGDGRLVLTQEGELRVGPAAGTKPEKEEPGKEDDDAFVDPEIKGLKAANQDLKGKLSQLETMLFADKIKGVKEELDTRIKTAMEKNQLADEDEVWILLGQNDEKTGRPTYNAETAVAKSHAKHEKRFQKWAEKNHPDFNSVPQEKKDQIVNEYLAQKATKEEAPVGAPSGTPTPKPASDKPKPKSFSEALEMASRDLNPVFQQGKKT